MILLCLPVIYKYWRHVAIIVAILYIVVSVIFVVCTVTILIKQNEKISAIEAKLQHEAEVSDIRVYENLLQEIKELEQNISNIVLQLEKDHSEEVRAIRKTFNEWNKTLVNATAKISQLEDTLNNAKMRINELEQDQTQLASELTQTKQDLITTNDSLHDARKQISQLERDLSNMTDRTSMIERDQLEHTIEQMQMREDLNATGEKLNNALDIIILLEDGLTNTTHRTAVVEAELLNIKIEVLSLNDTKASKVVVNEITDRVADLETEKVDKTEFANLSDNVTSLREDTSQADEDIREDLNDLADSTLNYTHYHQLQDGIDKLKQSKANQSNFEQLVIYVNELAESTVQTTDFLQMIDVINNTTMDLQGDIVELSLHIRLLEDGLTNTTHRTAVVEAELLNTKIEVLSLNDTKASKVVVNEITDRVADLETGKVDKTEFAILSDNVTSLREDTSQADEDIREDLNDVADSTLNYTHYHQLQDGIDKLKQSKANQSNFEHLVMHVSDLENSTVQTSDFVQLVESIENTTAEIGMEIALKANQSEINTLTEQITNLTATVVDRVEFDSLSINVTILRESTALEDETLHAEIEALADGSLNLTHHDQLKILIEQFALTKANQTDFEDLAFDVVTLETSVTSNDDDIENNRHCIEHAEDDIKQLKDDIKQLKDDIVDLEDDIADSSHGLKQFWTMIIVSALVAILFTYY